MKGQCAPGCGDCCDPVIYGRSIAEVTSMLARPDVVGKNRRDFAFISAHWTETAVEVMPDGQAWYEMRCDRFDTASRTCTAHAERPPICSNYPWYSRTEAPTPSYSRCGYWLDTPAADRPAGVRPLLPLFVVGGS